jgi:hypothetical protein
MASFTDQIMQFNPYVQQLPVEAMAKVGMYKQQKYEEGVQKIQSYIDNVAGLDVVKPLHKQYLQSKLDELGGKLKSVAAGDFSNFQLVNSVGGMATQIAKDPTVQNAVASTQRITKEKENIQIAQKAGKSSVNNEDYFYNQVNSWLNDNNLSSSFTGEYIEYKDVDAKLRDLTSKLKEDEISVDNIFKRNSAGQTLYYSRDPKTGKETVSTDPTKGEEKLDLDMLSTKVKGVSAQRILNNFYNSLDANDIRQLKIDSWGHYRGAGPEAFEKSIKDSYANKKEMLDQQKKYLAVKIQDVSITGPAKDKLIADLKDINDKIDKKVLEKELAEDLSELQNPKNLEEFKYKLYTQNHLTNLAKDLSYQSYIQERKANPAAQADLARQEFQFRKVQEANDNYWKGITEGRLGAEFEYKKKRDRETDQKELLSKGYRVSPGDWGTDIEPPTVQDLNNDMLVTAKTFTDEQTRIANLLYPSSDSRYKNMSLSDKIGALEEQASNYRKNANVPLTPDQKIYLEQYKNNQDAITKSINRFNSAVGFEQKFKKDYIEKNLTGAASVTVKGKTYTALDADDFNSNLQNIKSPKIVGKTGEVRYTLDDDKAEKFFKTYKNGKLYPMWQAYSDNNSTFSLVNSDEKKLVDFTNSVKKVSNDLAPAAAAATSKYISQISPQYTVQRARIDISDKKKAQDLDDFLVEKNAQFDSKGALNTRDLGDYSPATAATIRTTDGSTFQIEKRYDGSAAVIMRGKDGSKQVIPATPSELSRFFPEVAVTSPFNALNETIMTSDTRTTNSANQRFVPGSGATAVNATISGYDKKFLPQLKGSGYESKVRFDVEGLETNTGNPETDIFTVVMYVPDPKTGGWKGDYVTGEDGGEYVSAASVTTLFSMVTPLSIEQAIKRFK